MSRQFSFYLRVLVIFIQQRMRPSEKRWEVKSNSPTFMSQKFSSTFCPPFYSAIRKMLSENSKKENLKVISVI